MTNHYLEQVNSESVNNVNQVKITILLANILAGVVVKHGNCNTKQACKNTIYLIDLCIYSITHFLERE